jgi:hypothetical protein
MHRNGRSGLPGPWIDPCRSRRSLTMRSRSGRIGPPGPAMRLADEDYVLDSAVKRAGPDPGGQWPPNQRLRVRACSWLAGTFAAHFNLAPS